MIGIKLVADLVGGEMDER